MPLPGPFSDRDNFKHGGRAAFSRRKKYKREYHAKKAYEDRLANYRRKVEADDSDTDVGVRPPVRGAKTGKAPKRAYQQHYLRLHIKNCLDQLAGGRPVSKATFGPPTTVVVRCRNRGYDESKSPPDSYAGYGVGASVHWKAGGVKASTAESDAAARNKSDARIIANEMQILLTAISEERKKRHPRKDVAGVRAAPKEDDSYNELYADIGWSVDSEWDSDEKSDEDCKIGLGLPPKFPEINSLELVPRDERVIPDDTSESSAGIPERPSGLFCGLSNSARRLKLEDAFQCNKNMILELGGDDLWGSETGPRSERRRILWDLVGRVEANSEWDVERPGGYSFWKCALLRGNLEDVARPRRQTEDSDGANIQYHERDSVWNSSTFAQNLSPEYDKNDDLVGFLRFIRNLYHHIEDSDNEELDKFIRESVQTWQQHWGWDPVSPTTGLKAPRGGDVAVFYVMKLFPWLKRDVKEIYRLLEGEDSNDLYSTW